MTRAHRAAPLAALLALIAAPAPGQDTHREVDLPLFDRTGLSMYLDRLTAGALPYDPATQWQSYRTISRVADVLRRENRYVTTLHMRPTDTFPAYPMLLLIDADGNGRAETFAYQTSAEDTDTLEFGMFFTLPGEGRPHWLVFNGGPGMQEDGQGGVSMFWATHHYIDRNGDGAFDIYAVNGGPDLAAPTDSEWIYDDDFDGRIDRAERIIDGGVQNLADAEGRIHPANPMGNYGEGTAIGAPFFAGADAVAADIAQSLEVLAQ
jgi:hypothetical protein